MLTLTTLKTNANPEIGCLVEVANEAGEKARFQCRNIGDVGKVINPGDGRFGLVNRDEQGRLFWDSSLAGYAPKGQLLSNFEVEAFRFVQSKLSSLGI